MNDDQRKAFEAWCEANNCAPSVAKLIGWQAGVAWALEQAAKVCDEAAAFHASHDPRAACVDQNRAEDIRALKESA